MSAEPGPSGPSPDDTASHPAPHLPPNPTPHPAYDLGRQMPPSVRDALSWLAHLIDAKLPLRAAEDDDEFASRHLGGAPSIAVREDLGPFTSPLVARALAADLRRHKPTDIAGPYSDESPRWDRLRLEDSVESVPSALIAAFAAGTLLPVPAVVGIETRWAPRNITVHTRADDAEAAEAYLQDLLNRARGESNYLRGRCVEVGVSDGDLTVRHLPTPRAARDDVVLPAAIWEQIDLNVSGLLERRALLEELGLGTNRGVLLVGPPGTGKSALCRVLAAELAGEVTVVLCTASAISEHLTDVYEEVRHLSPALVILEDLDLLVGNRGHGGGDSKLHAFLAALDGAMSRHRDVITVATTNDLKALDQAATRAARFDGILEVPLPDTASRATILERYLGRLSSAVDTVAVAAATSGASGADLRELIRHGVLTGGEDLTTAGLLQVVRGGAWAPTDTGMYL